MQSVIRSGLMCVVCAVHLIQLLNAGLIHYGGVGKHSAYHVILGELIVLGHLNAAQHVGNAGDAQPAHLLHLLVAHAQLVLHVGLALCGVEQAQQTLGILIVDGNGHVGILHVVDPGDVLVADALDAVAAEAVIQNGGALQSLAHS